MYSVLFAGAGERAELLAHIFASEGYGTSWRIVTTSLTEADLVAAEGSAIVFIDTALGIAEARTMLRQLRAHSPVGRAPLIALIGEPPPDAFDQLIADGADFYITDNPHTLAVRTRFLRGALERRAQLTKALEQVRISEAKYRAVISVLNDGIVVRRKDGSIETLNDSVMRMVGVDQATLTEENWEASPEMSMVRDDGTPLAKHEQPGFRSLAAGESIRDFVCGLVRPSRDIVWMSLSAHPLRDPQTGEITGSVTAMKDISSRRRAEDEFLELLDRAPAGVLIHRDGKILWVSEGLLRLLGYTSRQDLIGRRLFDLLPSQHVGLIEQRLADRSAHLEGPPIRHSVRRADGSELAVETIGMPTIFQGAPALIAYGRDLTEQRRLEAELMATERLASLGRLAASVGHEINNPLTYVFGNLELALRDLRQPHPECGTSKIIEMLEDALEGAERVRQIVDDLRIFAQRPNEYSSPVDLGEVIASCVRMTQGEIGQRARLVVDVQRLPFVHGNSARLAQVVTNLLLNAVQSMSEVDLGKNTLELTARFVDDKVVVRVADTGAGIAPEHLPLVFEPFFTTKTARGGTGLGLAVSRSLVTAMGGELTLTSAIDRGTEVTLVLLPTVPRPPLEGASTQTSNIARWRILLVDDEPKIVDVLRESLEPHDVTVAASAAHALALLADNRYDVIVCDLMMPAVSGIDLYDHLKTTQPGVEQRIVFMTGGAFTPRASAFLASVRNRCLEKPFQVQTLFEAIDEVARGS